MQQDFLGIILFRQIIRAMRRRVKGTTRIIIVSMDCCFSTTTRNLPLFWSGFVTFSNSFLTMVNSSVSYNASSVFDNNSGNSEHRYMLQLWSQEGLIGLKLDVYLRTSTSCRVLYRGQINLMACEANTDMMMVPMMLPVARTLAVWTAVFESNSLLLLACWRGTTSFMGR